LALRQPLRLEGSRAPVPQNSTACSNEVDVFLGEAGHRTIRRPSTSRLHPGSKSSQIP